MEQEDGLQISELISLIWRRKWLFAITTLLVFVIGLVVVFKLPATYRSTGLILVEQQEIPTQWVNSTVASYADERIQAIGQRVLTTENLSRIIKKFDLYANSTGAVSIDALVARARGNFSVENVRARIRDRNTGNTGSATIAFRISFEDPSAETARDVATELVKLYLDKNVQSRTKAITDTRKFLETEADRLEQNLAEIESRISDFKEKNYGALPEHQQLNISAYQRTEEQIAGIDRSLDSLNERKIILEAGIDSARRYIRSGRQTNGAPAAPNPLQQRLTELQSQLSGLKTRYSDEHPDLIKLKREIVGVQAQLNEADASAPTANTTVVNVFSEQGDTSLVRLNTELASASSEQDSLRIRKGELITKQRELELLINKTPEVEREYSSLIRDHENIQAKYNDIRGKQNSARVAESLEVEQKGERFTLIEPPRLPVAPYKPNRKKLAAMALGGSMAGGFGLIFIMEWLSGRIRNARGLERIAGVPVLVSIGVIDVPADSRRRKFWAVFRILLLLALVACLAFAIQHYGITKEDLTLENLKPLFQDWLQKIKSPGVSNG